MENAFEIDWCPVLAEMLSTGFSRSLDGEKVSIAGTSTLNNIRAIREIIQREKPDNTLEIGLAYGASALAFLATLSGVHGNTEFYHRAVDPFQLTAWRGAGLAAVRAAGFGESRFSLIESDSALALPRLCEASESFEVIYIDGSHLFEDVFIDFFYCSRLLATGGLILFDDCTDKHVKKVIGFIDSNYSQFFLKEEAFERKSIRQQVGHRLGLRQLVSYRKIGSPPRDWNSRFRNF